MGLQQNILADPLSELDLRPLTTAPPHTSVREAVALMRRKNMGCLVVVDEQNKPIGKFTEMVVTNALAAHGAAALDMQVDQYMMRDPECLKETDPIIMLLEMMQSLKIRYVVIVDEQGKAVSLTGQKGLMRYIAEHFPRQVKVQEMDSKLHMDEREGA